MITAIIKRTVILIVLILSSGCASRFFYYPDHRVYQTPRQAGLEFEEVSFTSSDGTPLTGWFIPARGKAIGTVIHFHGNAQNMTAHFSFVNWLPAEGFNVFTFDYRGYGHSGGTPQRRGIHNDCIAAMEYITTRPGIDQNTLVIFGQSLGGANALAVLGEKRYDGVKAAAIDSTFYSYRTLVRDRIEKIPLLWIAKWPLSFLVISNSHSPGSSVQNISPTPLLLIHGTADRVIPYHHAQDLFNKAREPKQLWTVQGGNHTDAFSLYSSSYRKSLVQFFTDALSKGK